MPANGYTYKDEACKLISTDQDHRYNIHDFYNDERTYTLRLIKENSDHNILLNGAKFKISYFDNDEIKEIQFITGALYVENPNNEQYLHTLHNDVLNVIEVNGNDVVKYDIDEGKYYYYFSNSDHYDETRIKENHTYVLNGGYTIEDIPYSSFVRVVELEAPQGYKITESEYTIQPDISYDEITFKNYRVNDAIVIPAKKRKQVLTCVEE